MDYPGPHNRFLAKHVSCLNYSYQRLLGKPLLAGDFTAETLAERLFQAPFALVSHDTAADPVFNYANFTALQLFAMDWQEFTQLPSRLSAEPVNQAERARLLELVTRQGFIADYEGIRIAKTGRRFLIKNAVVWNLLDEAGCYRGQAACFADWTYL